jgi:HlyD family secretion protein
MATTKKRRKTIVFTGIGLVLIALTCVAMFRKRDVVITVQSEKVGRRSLTEIVVANGKIQPVVQVKISPEVSGEIIELPVKEGQAIKKGDLLVKIKPDFYAANRNQAEAAYKSSVAAKTTSEANLRKAESEFKRFRDLLRQKLVSESAFDEAHAAFDVATAQLSSAGHQVEMAKANLDSAEESLAKTTIVSPLTGTVSKLNSQLGERVLGTVQNMGTEIMIIADLNEMEARVDIGEIDVVLIEPCQNVRLEVDAFKDRKFSGSVTEVANSSKGFTTSSGNFGGASQQEATKFEVKIRIKEKEVFRPGMSVTAEIETRSRNNVLAVPIASVTTRMPKDNKDKKKGGAKDAADTKAQTNSTTVAVKTNSLEVAGTNSPAADGTNVAKGDKKKDAPKPIEVVFVMEGDHVKMVPVKIGISDDSHWEITEGLTEGQEIVSGGFRAISRDLEDGKKVKKGPIGGDMAKGEKKAEQ